jgi:hypothetical protein
VATRRLATARFAERPALVFLGARAYSTGFPMSARWQTILNTDGGFVPGAPTSTSVFFGSSEQISKST